MLSALGAQAFDYTSVEKFNIESAVNIMKDVEAKNVDITGLPNFIANYQVSQDVSELVTSYVEQGIKSTDLKKQAYGEYVLEKKHSNSNRVGNLGTRISIVIM